MNVLHVIDSGGLYGAEMMLLNLVAEQIKMGYGVEIASIGEKGISEKPFESQAVAKGFAVKKFRMRPGPNFTGALSILSYAENKRFDVLHSHGYKGNILLGFWPRRVRRIPLASTIHGYTSTSGLSKMKLYEWLDTISLKFIDKVILVNRGMLANPKLKINGVDFLTINNGISDEIDSFDSDIESEIKKFCMEGFIIGALGRLSNEKGFKFLVEAVSILAGKGENVRLLLIGEGYQRQSLEEQVRIAGIADRVYMPGFKTNAARYFPLFDMLAMPSLTEGLPITLLEAMRAGIPIIATRVGGIPHVLENRKSAILVPAADSKAMADAIAQLMEHPDTGSELTRHAKSVFLSGYTSRQMAWNYHQAYYAILNTDSKRSLNV